MKITTFSIRTGSSLIVRHNSSDIGTLLSLLNSSARTPMLSPRLLTILWASSWASRCCKMNYLYYCLWKGGNHRLCCKRFWRMHTRYLRQNIAALNQITCVHSSQWLITPLMVFPNSINIPTPSLVEPRRLRAEWSSFNSTIAFLICGSSAFRSMLWSCNRIWKVNWRNNNNDNAPR